ncbi:MAG: HAMP domain-containing histidine kinase, partial [Bryobacterales bacterium]|nr:HAMP domain-containing histidine kinase [Bryobacterales bacterium]
AADLAIQTLSAIVADPSLTAREPGSGALAVAIPGGQRLFHARPALPKEAAAGLFSAAEQLEIRENNTAAAVDAYRRLARTHDQTVRAGALLRLARTLRNSKNAGDALQVYDELETLETAGAGGLPAPAAALWGRCTLLEAMGRKQDLREAATRLRASLDKGRWPLTRSDYEAFAAEAERWTGLARPKDLELLTGVVNELETAAATTEEPVYGARLVRASGVPVTLVWRRTREGFAVFAATPAYVAREWLPRAGRTVWLKDEAGADLTQPVGPEPVLRYPGQTRLPWTVAVATPPPAPELATRTRLLLLLLLAVGVFSVAGGYVVLRALLKEFALARMQEDFVAAVSHEFRTPLTTLVQISESLEDGRVANEQHRNAYYRSLSQSARRLQRLVEDLLDFRRMQSGAVEYRKAPLNASELARDVVAGFQREVDEQGFRIDVRQCAEAHVVADSAALGRALWNLLDNAVKYSGASRTIEVAVECGQRDVGISVRDRGIGIQPEEQARVFGKFYRGGEARKAGIRGTGIGLAMVRQIAEAHGGRVDVKSEPGIGSTFTMTIPREENRWPVS